MRPAAAALAAGLLGLAALPAAAADGFYAGLAGSHERQDVRYFKAVGHLARGVSAAHGDADRDLSGLGAFAGYRRTLSEAAGVWLAGELEWTAHSGTLRGQYPGACLHGGECTYFGDAWPEAWTLEKDTSRALTLRLGVRADFLGPGASLYLLAGVRRIQADFSVTYRGCGNPGTAPRPGPPVCDDGDDADSLPDWWDATDRLGRNFDAWTFGAGLERFVGERFALQAELRYTDYDREAWAPVPVVRAALSGREVGAALRLARYF